MPKLTGIVPNLKVNVFSIGVSLKLHGHFGKFVNSNLRFIDTCGHSEIAVGGALNSVGSFREFEILNKLDSRSVFCNSVIQLVGGSSIAAKVVKYKKKISPRSFLSAFFFFLASQSGMDLDPSPPETV